MKPKLRLNIIICYGSSNKLYSLSYVTTGKHCSKQRSLALAGVHCCRANQGAALKPGAKRRAASKLVLASLGDVPSKGSIPTIMTVNCDSR